MWGITARWAVGGGWLQAKRGEADQMRVFQRGRGRVCVCACVGGGGGGGRGRNGSAPNGRICGRESYLALPARSWGNDVPFRHTAKVLKRALCRKEFELGAALERFLQDLFPCFFQAVEPGTLLLLAHRKLRLFSGTKSLVNGLPGYRQESHKHVNDGQEERFEHQQSGAVSF